MNMNTLYQELSKKFDNMGVEDFCLFIRRLVTMYMTKHKPNLQICVAEKINTQIHKALEHMKDGDKDELR